MSAIPSRPLSAENIAEPNNQLHRLWDETTANTRAELNMNRPLSLPRLSNSLTRGIARRWQRELRRRKVGRAYDMALEIARAIPQGSRVLDVGCGNGYIAHHLSALLGSRVTGIDVTQGTEAGIPYWQFDGQKFPVRDKAFDAALFCYVLHHAQSVKPILAEARRTLCDGGLLVVYEDIPERWWDRMVCAIHDRKWRKRTGPCTFRGEREWRDTFASEGFELCGTRRLSRWRKVVHPVNRRLFLLRLRATKKA